MTNDHLLGIASQQVLFVGGKRGTLNVILIVEAPVHACCCPVAPVHELSNLPQPSPEILHVVVPPLVDLCRSAGSTKPG